MSGKQNLFSRACNRFSNALARAVAWRYCFPGASDRERMQNAITHVEYVLEDIKKELQDDENRFLARQIAKDQNLPTPPNHPQSNRKFDVV